MADRVCGQSIAAGQLDNASYGVLSGDGAPKVGVGEGAATGVGGANVADDDGVATGVGEFADCAEPK